MKTRPAFIGVALVLAALGLLALAYTSATGASQAAYEGPPYCDGEAMSPGDICMRFGRGAHTSTYEEDVAEGEASAVSGVWTGVELAGGFGALLLIAGSVTLFRPLGRRGSLPAAALVVVPLAGSAALMWGIQQDAQAASVRDVSMFPWLGANGTVVATLVVAVVGAVVAVFAVSVDLDTPVGRSAVPPSAIPTSRTSTSRTPTDRELAQKSFEKGETSDPWAPWRVDSGRLGGLAVPAWIIGVFLLAGALTVALLPADLLPADGLITIAPGALTIAGGFFIGVQWRRASSWQGWRFGVPALLTAVLAAVALSHHGPFTWPDLTNALAPTAITLVLARFAGQVLPDPPLSGRIVFTALSVASMAASVALAARDIRIPTVTAGVVLVLLVNAWFCADTATKCERGIASRAPGAIGRVLTVVALGAGAVVLTGSGPGWLGWTMVALFALSTPVTVVRVFSPPKRVKAG